MAVRVWVVRMVCLAASVSVAGYACNQEHCTGHVGG